MAELNVLDREGYYKVETSNDFMEAYLILELPVGNGDWPRKEKALETLRSENIVYGLIENAMEEAVTKRSVRTLIARGQPPVAGVDAEIKLFFEAGTFRKSSENIGYGNVDFRDVQTIQSIHAGDIIGEKVPATLGQDGYDVRGRRIMATPGKDKQIKLVKNVEWSPDNLKLIATSDGEPVIINNRLGVYPVHEIRGDVNFESGNVKFSGNLMIHGNVESGFKVEAEGDITIQGNVDSAVIIAGGNLLIRGGVSGMDKSELHSGGDLTAKYIERATVYCAGNLTVREAIMYCKVYVDLKLTMEGGKGLIVGGVIRCGGEISAKSIGSRLGTVTELEAGVKPQLKQELQEIENRLKVNTESLEKADKAITILSKMPNLPSDRQEMLDNLIKTSYALKGQRDQDEIKCKEIIEEIVVKSKERGRVKVSDTIYPGVRVTIGKSVKMIPDEYKFVVLFYNEGEVQLQSYR